MKKPAVSVIVPVYNVEKYLGRCLDSLVMQTVKYIEIIVVYDGSPDGSQDIIDEYVRKHENVVSFKKENGGLGDARNFGLERAKGEYIGFIDSDDWAEPDMYEKMYAKAKEDDCDLVVCDLIYTFEDGSKEDYTEAGIRKLVPDNKKAGFLSPLFAWNKLYKKELLMDNSLRYPVGLWYEDIPVTLPCFALSKKTGYVNEAFVHYVQRVSSIMGNRTSRKFYDIFTVLDSVYAFFKEHDLLDEYHDELEYVFAQQLMVYGTFRFLRSDDYYDLSETARRFMNERYPEWKGNAYLKKTFNIKNRIFYRTNGPATYRIWKKLIG